MDQHDSAVMLTAKRSAGVAPEVNPRNALCAGDKACQGGIHSGFETQKMSPEVQNRGISGSTKWTVVLQRLQIQESIPVGCMPPACDDCTCFNSHQMSAPWVGGPVVNNFEQVSSDGHQMSPAGHGGPYAERTHVQGACTVRSHVRGARAGRQKRGGDSCTVQ